MIISLAKKLFPLCPCVALLISCGKKVEDGNASERSRQDVKLPDALTLEASATSGYSQSDATYAIPRDGDIELPATITASGPTGAYRVRLDVNISEGEEEFHCTWKGNGTAYQFEKCADPDDRDLGITAGNLHAFPFPIDQGKSLKLHLEAAPTSTTVKAAAALPANWK